jgi:hypothetical protein
MSTLRAELINKREAFRVHEFDVIPPFVLFALVFELGVEAGLSQVFTNNLFSFNSCGVSNSMVGRAIFARREAFSLFEVLSAGSASPGNKSRCEIEVFLEVLHILVKFLDEV